MTQGGEAATIVGHGDSLADDETRDALKAALWDAGHEHVYMPQIAAIVDALDARYALKEQHEADARIAAIVQTYAAHDESSPIRRAARNIIALAESQKHAAT